MRVTQLAEALQRLRTLWTTEGVTFEGQYYRVRAAQCEPKPEPPPTLMVGAFKPRMLRLAARYADWWNVSSLGAAAYRQAIQECERACEAVGRDPATLKRTWSGGCVCAPTDGAARAKASERSQAEDDPDDFAFAGTPQQVVEQMQPFIEMGVDYFLFDCGGFPDLTTLELLVHAVLPQVNA